MTSSERSGFHLMHVFLGVFVLLFFFWCVQRDLLLILAQHR